MKIITFVFIIFLRHNAYFKISLSGRPASSVDLQVNIHSAYSSQTVTGMNSLVSSSGKTRVTAYMYIYICVCLRTRVHAPKSYRGDRPPLLNSLCNRKHRTTIRYSWEYDGSICPKFHRISKETKRWGESRDGY